MNSIIAIGFIAMSLMALPDTDQIIAEQYAEEHYGTAQVKVVRNATEQDITSRNGKVLIEIIDTESCGEYGLTEEGYYVKYSKTVPVGEQVTSYLIYNPENNAIDDVVAVIDNGMIR